MGTSAVTGSVWASLNDQASAGPESFVTAALTPSPTSDSLANAGCAGTNQHTNVSVSWTDSQSAASDAAGGSLVTGYSVSQAPTSGGTYSAAGSVTGSPAPTTYADVPTVASVTGALVANTAHQVLPLSETTLSAGAALAIGAVSNEVNAVQVTPDGLTAVIAEYGSSQIQVLTWSGSVWVIAKTLAAATPTAVAIDPVPNGSNHYVAYVVSDPGTTVNGSVFPVMLNGAASSLGTAIAIQHQANPTSIVATPNGAKVYVTNYNSNTLSSITTATAAVSNIALPGTAAHPVALATTFDSSHVYLADRANNYIDDVTVATNVVSAHITLAANALNDTVLSTSGNPNVLAMLPSGQSLYVAEFGAAQVQVVNTALGASPDTLGATISTGSGSQPIDVASSPNGCLVYVADLVSHKVLSIMTSTNAEATAFTATCQTRDPQPMEVTPDNQYLIVPENNTCGDIQILNTSTGLVTTVTGVGTSPTIVAVPPVPIWFETAATHGFWNSVPSAPSMISVGWNPGGWQ